MEIRCPSMKKRYLRLATLLLVQCGLAAHASKTLMVQTPFDGTTTSPLTLRAAIAEANNDSNPADFPYIIQLPLGTYTLSEGELAIGNLLGSGLGSNVIIIGTGTAQNTIISQDGTRHVFDLDPNTTGKSTFAFANLTIKGGNDQDTTNTLSYGTGGGAIITGDFGNGGDKLMVTNCIFENNTSEGSDAFPSVGGGAISSQGGSVVLVGCTFTNNTLSGFNVSDYFGGAVEFVALDPGDTLTATGCTFVNNSVTASVLSMGGAVAGHSESSYATTMNLTACVFTRNSANSGGGAVYAASNSVNNIVGCAFLINQASVFSGDGGAIEASAGNSTTSVNLCRFLGNSATNGTAIFLTSGTGGSFNANSNWWLSQSGPPAGAIAGTGISAPTDWLTLTIAAKAPSVELGQSVSLIATFDNSSRSPLSPTQFAALTNLPVSFTGTDGSISSAQTVIQTSGTATATFTGTTDGSGSASATVDGVTTNVTINIVGSAAPTTVTLENVNPTSATLNVIGGTPGLLYEVLASEDLKSWSSIGSVVIPQTGPTNFVDTSARLYPNRFYETKYP